jgi:tetratricopeptide (TPR) repeat protein
LLLFVVLAVTVAPAFAEDSWMVAVTDKEQYFTGESMEVSGYIMDRKMPVIAMSVYDPDGVILSANNVELQEDGGFAKTISLDSPFYDKSGTYLIRFDYGQNTDQLSFEVIGTLVKEPQIPQVVPQVLVLATDKKSYADGEFITVSGMVSAIGDPTILVGIYDKNNFPAGFYTPEIDSNLEFSVSFLAKGGVNFKTPGTYYVKAHYGESRETISFDFVEKPKPTPDNNENAKPALAPQQQPVQTSKPKQETRVIPAIDTRQQREPVQVQEHDNLSVEDRELGIMLNEITLNCDYAEYLDTIIYYDGMGPALMRLCNYEQAISYFDRALTKEPDNVDIITNKATAYSKLGKIGLAIDYYDAALEIKPDYLPALNNKANALAQLGRYEEAISIYNSILEKDPTYTISQTNLEKASENLVQYVKSRNPEDISNVEVKTDVAPRTETVVVRYDEDAKQPSIFDHIGSIFAGFFGFLS